MHATSVTNVIDRLESAGLVRREPNPRDGRGTLAVITDEGRAVAAKATADLNAARFGMSASTVRNSSRCTRCCVGCGTTPATSADPASGIYAASGADF